MKFGKVDNPGEIDFTLPPDHPETQRVLEKWNNQKMPAVFVGCAKWNRQDLKNFYPKGTSDELTYYASQFNAVELNATYYKTPSPQQAGQWYKKTPEGFKFFPKVNRYISHMKWLSDVEKAVDDFYDSIIHFKEKLGTTFLQLRDNFSPKFFDRVEAFVDYWPELPLAIEFRHPDWYNDPSVANELYALLEEHSVGNVLVDTAGRRDLMHMRMTNGEAFIRYVGANHPTDVDRLNDWVPRLKQWSDQGLRRIHFFVHQNKEQKSPQLASHFIKNLNGTLDSNLKVPAAEEQGDLF